MKFLQRTAAAVLGGAVLCSSVAFAVQSTAQTPKTLPKTDVPTAETQTPQIMPERNLYYGKITEIIAEEGTIKSLRMESEAKGEMVFHVNENTLYLDSGNGVATMPSTLEVGQGVYVYHGSAMTMSLPPQTYAEAIVTNIPQDAGCAKLHTVEAVQKNEDGSVTVLTDRGSLELTIDKEATYMPYLTRQMVGADDIQVGTRLFTWYQGVQESYPAKVTVNRVVLAPRNAQGSWAIQVGEKKLEGQFAEVKHGVVMVPASAVAKEMGFTAKYEKTAQGEVVTLENGTTKMTMTIGEDVYKFGEEERFFGAAPVIEEGTTWMPAEALAALTGNTISLASGALEFQSAKA